MNEKKSRTNKYQLKTEQLKAIDSKTLSNKNKEAIKAIDLEDKIELERREAYIEPKTRDLLRKLLQGGDKRRNNS